MHPATGAKCDPTDANLQIPYAVAQAIGPEVSWCVTAPHFCVDIDNSKQADGMHSLLAQDICSKFKGAYIEQSRSGNGLHIIARYIGQPPEHKKKNTRHHLELYTERRHIVLTGNAAPGGNSGLDCTQALEWLIETYFKIEQPAALPAPVATGGELLSDEEVIKKMLASKGNAFRQDKIHPKYLWDADVNKCAEKYPSASPDKDFDHSSADSSLCMHLAFWTSGNIDQMDRLFRRSGLMREKWERDDYRNNTLNKALQLTTERYLAKPIPAMTEQPAGEELNMGYRICPPSQQVVTFDKCVYVASESAIRMPNGILYKHDQFRDTVGGWDFQLDCLNDKVTRDAWEAFTQCRFKEFPKADDVTFDPFAEPGAIMTTDGIKLVNMYMPHETPSTAGDPTPFLNHLTKLIPDDEDRKILLCWMAAVIQNPWKKIVWAPVIQGCEGNGKSAITDIMYSCVGEKYSFQVSSDDIGNKFNSWVKNKRLIIVPEINTKNKRESMEILKPLIGDVRIQVQAKGSDQETNKNYACFMMTTNHKDALLVDDSSRRYAIFITAQQSAQDLKNQGMDGEYFNDLYNWINNGGSAVVNHYLKNYKIAAELNPHGSLQRAPQTSTMHIAIEESEHSQVYEMRELIESAPVGMRGGWVSSVAMGRELNFNKHYSGRLQKDLGYIHHPALNNGRANRPSVLDDGKQPRLFVKPDHYTLAPGWTGDILDAYIQDQSK